MQGTSRSGHGIQGSSSSSFGVVGITTENATSESNARAGVLGEDESTNQKAYNSGVAGTSEYGIGVSAKTIYGTALVANGVHGVGIVAFGFEGDGIDASSRFNGVAATGSTAVLATGNYYGVRASGDVVGITSSSSTTAGLFSAGSDAPALIAQSSGSGTSPTLQIAGVSSSKGILIDAGGDKSDAMILDSEGNETLAGTLTQKGSAKVRTRSTFGNDVASYGSRSASPTLEDFGTGQLRDGVATVALDRTFASTIDSRNYLVFVTPHGNSNGLYTQSSPTGFVVRENNGGRSTVAFDYRIVAKPLDAETRHLPAMSNMPHFAKHMKIPVIQRSRNTLASGLPTSLQSPSDAHGAHRF